MLQKRVFTVAFTVVFGAAANAGPTQFAGGDARMVGMLADELRQGLAALDEDGDGGVETRLLMTALREVGFGKPVAVQRGRGGGADPDERFASLDANRDGKLTGDEPGPYMRRTEYFKDGEVTLDEYRKAWQELAQRRGGPGRGSRGGGESSGVSEADVEFAAKLDADKDGSTTAAEIRAAVQSDYEERLQARLSLDVDGDGRVTAREYALSQPSRGDDVDEDGLSGHARSHFEREDLDRDGSISRAEVAQRAFEASMRRVRSMRLALQLRSKDADADGTLSADEAAQAVEALGPAVKIAELYPKVYALSDGRARFLDRPGR